MLYIILNQWQVLAAPDTLSLQAEEVEASLSLLKWGHSWGQRVSGQAAEGQATVIPPAGVKAWKLGSSKYISSFPFQSITWRKRVSGTRNKVKEWFSYGTEVRRSHVSVSVWAHSQVLVLDEDKSAETGISILRLPYHTRYWLEKFMYSKTAERNFKIFPYTHKLSDSFLDCQRSTHSFQVSI